MKFIKVLLLTLFLIPSSSYAKNIWTDCGIGAMIFSETKWAAAISNVIWDWGTTATSSMTSSDSQCAGKQVTAAKFIHETYVNLEEETAAGQGKHLNAMLDILGCDRAAHGAIISDIRADFSKDVSQSEYSKRSALQKTEAYHTNVMNKVTSKYAVQCSTT